jgi:uncharacterized protein (TIGR02569 family)
MSSPPPETVLHAFGAPGPLVMLAGGRGNSWRAGDLVFKPLDMDEDGLAWQAQVLNSIPCRGFRVAPPRPAGDGRWVVEGWCASQWVAGKHERERWSEIISVGERFHSELTRVPRPALIDRRTDPWSIGDRVAWEELPADPFRRVPHLESLLWLRGPVKARSQLIHGDLTGNVLFAPGEPPAIIDFAPYWRSAAFASAIVIADALCWEGADETLLRAVDHVEDLGPHLVRALIYRLVTDAVFHGERPISSERAAAYTPAVALTERLVRTGES